MADEITQEKHRETLGLHATAESLRRSADGWIAAFEDTAAQVGARIDQLVSDYQHAVDQVAQRDELLAEAFAEIERLRSIVERRARGEA